MQAIPDNLNITTGYHVFETPDDVIINSQIYDKVDMKPKDYHFWNTNYCLNNRNLLLHECNIVGYSWTKPIKEPDYEYYIQDNQDSSIFYFLTERTPSDTDQYICKAKKINNSYEILNSISPDSAWNPIFIQIGSFTWATIRRTQDKSNLGWKYLNYKILGQTNDYILVSQIVKGLYYIHGDFNYSLGKSLVYYVINKNDFSVKYLNRLEANDYSVYFIKSIGNYMYLYETYGQSRSGNLFHQKIIKYDLASNTITDLHDRTLHINTALGISNLILFKNRYYTLSCSSDGVYYLFNVFDINFKTDNVTFKEVKIFGTQVYNDYPVHNYSGRTDFLNDSWIQIDLKNIDDTYISATWHDNSNCTKNYINMYQHQDWTLKYSNSTQAFSQTTYSDQGWHRHLLFKINCNSDDPQSVDYKGMIPPEKQNQHMYGLLYINQYTPVFFFNDKIAIYKFDPNTETYDKKFDLPGIYYTVGLDSNKNLYIFDESNKCSFYNTDSSNELKVKFAKKEYKYNNENINTYVSIYAKNLLDDYINTNVKITLSGNCNFENGLQELYTNTEDTGIIDIPVTITYGGRIYCYIEEV